MRFEDADLSQIVGMTGFMLSAAVILAIIVREACRATSEWTVSHGRKRIPFQEGEAVFGPMTSRPCR